MPRGLAEGVVHGELECLKKDIFEVSTAAHQLSCLLLHREASTLPELSLQLRAVGLAVALTGAR